MNIAAPVPGPSFEHKTWGDNATPTQIALAWYGYERSGDGLYSAKDFMLRTLEGGLYHFSVGIMGATLAFWGLELLGDDRGPYTSFLYFDKVREGVPLRDFAGEVIRSCATFTKLNHRTFKAPGPARMLLRGRPGWQRLLPRLGIEIDPDGWITEDQEAFGYGHLRRQY